MPIDSKNTGPIFCEYYKQCDYIISAEHSKTGCYEVFYADGDSGPFQIVGDLSLRLAQLLVEQLY